MTTNFDRAAPFYDDTRGLPETTMAALTDRLAYGLGRAEAVLELGVGTGRVAVPLTERGYAMTGIDVSEKMLAVLDAKSSAVEAQVADATNLPFGDASFDAVLAVDFFHLVSEWRRAVDEAVRVLRPGGRIVLSTFAVLDDPTTVLRQRMFQEADTRPRRVGIEIMDVMADLEGRFGATSTELAAIPHVIATSLATELDGLRAGTWSRYWELPDHLRHRVADSIEGELRDAGADLAEPLDIKINLTVLIATQLG
jgi:ubiquinone/menaquinone biosynthesis C-methylase UbiE